MNEERENLGIKTLMRLEFKRKFEQVKKCFQVQFESYYFLRVNFLSVLVQNLEFLLLFQNVVFIVFLVLDKRLFIQVRIYEGVIYVKVFYCYR